MSTNSVVYDADLIYDPLVGVSAAFHRTYASGTVRLRIRHPKSTSLSRYSQVASDLVRVGRYTCTPWTSQGIVGWHIVRVQSNVAIEE